MKRWPFFHIGEPQNWEIRSAKDCALVLIVNNEGRYLWINWRNLNQYRRHGWVGRFGYCQAKILIAQTTDEIATLWPASTWDLGAAIVGVVGWLLALIVVLVLFVVLGNSQ